MRTRLFMLMAALLLTGCQDTIVKALGPENNVQLTQDTDYVRFYADNMDNVHGTIEVDFPIIEYYERKSFGRHVEASRLFLYKATRNLMKARGDSGAYLRSTMGAVVLFGVPPEPYWPYTDAEEAFDREPPAFCYAFTRNYRTLLYFRHDAAGVTRAAVFERLKTYLAAGHPAMFGFTVYSSVDQAETRPHPGPVRPGADRGRAGRRGHGLRRFL